MGLFLVAGLLGNYSRVCGKNKNQQGWILFVCGSLAKWCSGRVLWYAGLVTCVSSFDEYDHLVLISHRTDRKVKVRVAEWTIGS